MNAAQEIGALWRGGPLGLIERLCLASWRDAGLRVALYAYAATEEAPEGVEIRAAAEIAPEDAGEAVFRARLLAARPGIIWAAPRLYLAKPLAPREGRLIALAEPGLPSPDLLALPEGATRDALTAAPVDLSRILREAGELAAALPEGAFVEADEDRHRLLLKRAREPEEALGDATILALDPARLTTLLAGAEDGLPKWWSPLGKLLRKHRVDPRTASVAKSGPAPRPRRRGVTLGARKADPAGRVLIVTTMKNEGPFLLEWIAYHRSIGVTDFLVYTNDCTDGTDAFHDLLAKKGIVAEHRDNPFKTMDGVKPQHAALFDAQTRPVAKKANWIIPMDVDEYINIKTGQGHWQDLLDAAPEANMISMPWRLFGNGFVRDFEDRFITEQFEFCAPEFCRKPHQAWGFKTAFRNDGIYRKYGVHRPTGLKPKEEKRIAWVNGCGTPMPKSYHRTGWRMSKLTWGYDLVSLNHYSLRSSESFLVKRDRGRVNHVDRDQGLAYWFRMNHNAERDRTIMNKLPAARAEFDRLMQDEEIRAMHLSCVAAHRAKIDELKTRPDYAALLAEIEGPRLRGLSRMLHHFGNAVFLEGPGAVPEDLARQAEALEMADA